MFRKSIWKIASVIIVVTCMLVSASAVLADDSLLLNVVADKTSAQTGENVTYTYTVSNNSTDNITGLSLIDDLLGIITLPASELAPGENITATGSYVISASDFPGPLTNTANVTGTLSAGDNVTATSSASVELIEDKAAIELTKIADMTLAQPGDNVTYTYTIINTGNVDLATLSLTDDKLGSIILPFSTLATSENMTVTEMYTVVSTDLPGPLTNIATVSGYDESGVMVTANATATVKLFEDNPAIEITKAADKTSAKPGDNVTYTYTIINTGNVELTALSLTDNKLGSIVLPSSTLAASENMTVTETYTVVNTDLPGPLTNIATVTALDGNGEEVTATSNEVVIRLTEKQERYTKAEILRNRGVSGNGIDTAPGLQKFFNPNSNAAERAGKKEWSNGKGNNKPE